MKEIKKHLSVFVCICLVFAFASGCSSEGLTSSPGNNSQGGDISSTKANTVAEKSEYKVGETLSKDGLSITYVSSSNYESDNEFFQPADGKKYIRLLFHVDNQSKSDKTVSSFDFNCYADGYECSSVYYSDDVLSATLSSGRSADGAVYFEVPVDAKQVEVEYDIDWINSKKVKFIFQGDKESGLTFEKSTSVNRNAYHVGDTIETKTLRIKYLKASEYQSDNMFMQPGEGKKYIYIELEVENLSSSDQLISSFSFNCYADGSSCDGFFGMDDSLSTTLSSGRKAKGTVAFEVPINASVVEIEFEDNFWTENKIVFSYQ